MKPIIWKNISPDDEYLDLMKVEDFVNACKYNYITDDDGMGFWATDKQISNYQVFVDSKPENSTYVAWYNK